MKSGDEIFTYLNRLRDIINANNEIETEMGCKISTASISSFDIANSECIENRKELVIMLKMMKVRKKNVKLLTKEGKSNAILSA